jgi:hypothetical protein
VDLDSTPHYANLKNIFEGNLNYIYYIHFETWFLTLWEEHRLRVFENRVPRRIFGPKREKMTGDYRKLHNEELQNLYS